MKVLPKVEGSIRVASLCTGMGTDALACKALQSAWHQLRSDFDLPDMKFVHVMMCENEKRKREFLATTFKETKHMFGDVKEMGRARAYDYMSEKACREDKISYHRAWRQT